MNGVYFCGMPYRTKILKQHQNLFGQSQFPLSMSLKCDNFDPQNKFEIDYKIKYPS